jgi:spore coat polysaccharide biosynthesis predicted glycosyltransferase SpsG
VLVTLGGSDPENVTFKILQAFQHVSIKSSEIIVVVGGRIPISRASTKQPICPMRISSFELMWRICQR